MRRAQQRQCRVGKVILLGAIALGGTGCQQGKQAADSNVNFGGAVHSSSANTSAPRDERPVPPADAQYTLYCQTFAGPNHQEDARQTCKLLYDNTPMKKWYVVHNNDDSLLCYGFYRTIDPRDPKDGAEGERALADLNTVRTLRDRQGNRLFPSSVPAPIESPDPAANPAWDITRTKNAYWTIEIAVFKDSPDRKLAAVQSVAAAREKGVEAYYYHGPHASSVCIGAWPRAAAIERDVGRQNPNPDDALVVTPHPLPDAYKKELGNGVHAVAPQVEPVDPTLIAALAQWKEHSVNNQTRMKADAAGNPTDVPLERSVMVKVPHNEAIDTLAANSVDPVVPNKPASAADRATGGLRGFGE